MQHKLGSLCGYFSRSTLAAPLPLPETTPSRRAVRYQAISLGLFSRCSKVLETLPHAEFFALSSIGGAAVIAKPVWLQDAETITTTMRWQLDRDATFRPEQALMTASFASLVAKEYFDRRGHRG